LCNSKLKKLLSTE